MRVYELADELKLAPKELMAKAEAELGITFKSHSAAVTPDTATKIRQLLGKKEEKRQNQKLLLLKKQKINQKLRQRKKQKKKKRHNSQKLRKS